MKLIVLKDSKEASKKAAEIIRDLVKDKDDAVLGLATGSTPIETYENLIEMNKKNEISFKNVKTINLDEYIGLDGSHEQSYRYFMNTKLFDHIDINKANTHVPSGVADDLEEEARNYDALIDQLGGQNLQILGVGNNGHIGFNEPNEKLVLGTHLEDLTQSTIDANKRFFDSIDDVPKRAISMGMGSIFKAKKILVLAFGESKAQAIQALGDDTITPLIPVTLLKLHPDVTVIVDEKAASKLNK
ncbi:MAG: glucosamine-6-phosphate deaminase [Tissierellia bacterium]|nr:glucosamine-6-phosphate deaminase [Tissierellia bacterium]